MGANFTYSSSPRPHAPAPRPRTAICDTPIEDRGSYPSRTRILEGVWSRSSIGVLQNRGSRSPADPPGALLFFVIPGLGVARGHLGEALGPAGALLFFMIPGRRGSGFRKPWLYADVPLIVPYPHFLRSVPITAFLGPRDAFLLTDK